MTTQQHPAQFDWATELLDAQGHVTLSAQEAHEIGARLRRQHTENEALQAGYAAARLEIESLKSQIANHADELTVAHLDGRMRAAQPAGAQQPTTQPAPQQEAQEPVAWRELCRRLYVELYYCNQQMTSGKRPKWQQGETVRDVLADAKAALDAAPQPTPTPQADSVTAPAGGEINRLRAQVDSLTRDCGRQASKIAELGSDLKFQEEKHREDRARLQALYEHQRGECWYWQGDGQDHLESLCNTLPVVIRADQLRALVSTPPTQAADSVLEDAVPLTLEAINAMAREYPAEDLCGWSYRMGIADTERHHGIKGGQHGAE